MSYPKCFNLAFIFVLVIYGWLLWNLHNIDYKKNWRDVVSVTGHSFDSIHRLNFTCVCSELLCAGYTGNSIMGRLMINRIPLWVSGCSTLSEWAFHFEWVGVPLRESGVPLWVSGRSTWGCGCPTLSRWAFHLEWVDFLNWLT